MYCKIEKRDKLHNLMNCTFFLEKKWRIKYSWEKFIRQHSILEDNYPLGADATNFGHPIHSFIQPGKLFGS